MAAKQRDSYDPDLHQFTEETRVNPEKLSFLRWAVANGRLHNDGMTNHNAAAADVEPCEDGKCGICPRCR